MDLRKAILLKKPLRDSCNSLNNSTASLYESAMEDSDSSIYYSFCDNSIKNLDNTAAEISQDPEVSLISEIDDKENTVIMKHIDVQSSPEEDVKKTDVIKEVIEENMDCEESVIIVSDDIKEEPKESKTEVNEEVSEDKQIPDATPEKSLDVPTIVIEDPNKNLINPFTMSQINNNNSPISEMESSKGRESIDTDKVTAKKVLESAKKSASKIPMRTHLYSPIQRNSLDKKSKINLKPIAARRTIYETRSVVIQKPKKPVIPPVPAKLPSKMTAPKPVMHKCTSTGCLREFRTANLLEQHMKTHKPNSNVNSSSHQTFKCKWCDKHFELNNALTSHMIDKCTKITFNEKRKLLAEKDKLNSANDNKRRTVFVAPPAVKKRSPRRQTLNKSGITITPKKTLKCECGKKFTDVLEFANHTISHKYENALKQKSAAAEC